MPFETVDRSQDIERNGRKIVVEAPALCRNYPGLQSRPRITKQWLTEMLRHARALVTHTDASGRLDGVAIMFRLSAKTAHIEILCATTDAIDAGLQKEAHKVAKKHGMTTMSIALDASEVVLANSISKIAKLAKLIYDHREAIRSHSREFGQRLTNSLVSSTDKNFLDEFLRRKYPLFKPGGPETRRPWPTRKIEALVNSINAARSQFHASGEARLQKIRASLGEVQDTLQMMARRDGHRAIAMDLDGRLEGLNPEQITNAIAYEMRRAFRAPGGAGPCTDWLRTCFAQDECEREMKARCDGHKLFRAVKFILDEADQTPYGKDVRMRLAVMASMFWMRANSQYQREIDEDYIIRLLDQLKKHS